MCIDCFSDDRINSILVMAIRKENCAIVIVNIPVSECRSCHEKFISDDVSQELDDLIIQAQMRGIKA